MSYEFESYEKYRKHLKKAYEIVDFTISKLETSRTVGRVPEGLIEDGSEKIQEHIDGFEHIYHRIHPLVSLLKRVKAHAELQEKDK